MKPLNNAPLNLILAGVGGQGVYTLNRVLWLLCEKYSFQCQGSIFKGGAQQLGSIYSVLRIFTKPNADASHYSSQIQEGDLDLLLGLEPWETLRYLHYSHANTQIVMNTKVSPLLLERYRDSAKEKRENEKEQRVFDDPVQRVLSLKLPTIAEDFTARACTHFQKGKMANFLLGQAAIEKGLLPFTESDYIAAFHSVIDTKKNNEKNLKQTAPTEGYHA